TTAAAQAARHLRAKRPIFTHPPLRSLPGWGQRLIVDNRPPPIHPREACSRNQGDARVDCRKGTCDCRHMKIERALAVPVRGGYFNEDLEAIRRGARRDGFIYTDRPVSPGFTRIQMPSEAISIVLALDCGVSVWGDAMSVEYSAAGGRRGR